MNTMPHVLPRALSMVYTPPRRSSTRRSTVHIRSASSPVSMTALPEHDVAAPSPQTMIPGVQFVDGSTIEEIDEQEAQRSGSEESDRTVVEPEKTEEEPEKMTVTTVEPFAPFDTRRYDKRSRDRLIHLRHQEVRSSVLIKTMKKAPKVGEGWRRYVHPEGMPYYYHPSKEVPIITENDLCDEDMRALVEEGYEKVMDAFEDSPISLGGLLHPELCLQILPHDPSTVYYYFVDHESECVFWLDDEVSSENLGLHRFLDDEHLKLQLRSQYFRHVENFPRVNLAPSVEDELIQMITWNSIDFLTCPTSTSPYDKATLDHFLTIVKTCPSNLKTFIVARLMSLFISHQFFNCYGLPVARLERTMSIEALPEHPVGWPMKLIFAFLLNAPQAHLKKLNELRVDEVLYKIQWPKFLEGLIRDWSEISVLASIVLASNMGFLSISQDLVSCTISLVSTVLGLGSIIVSLVNGRQQQSRMEAGAEEGGLFLERVHHPRLGLQPLAIYLALPYTMMLWSVISFAGAIVSFCFRAPSNDDNGGGGGGGGGGANVPDMTSATTAIMLAVVGAVGLVVVITISFVWLDDRRWVSRSRNGWKQWWETHWGSVKEKTPNLADLLPPRVNRRLTVDAEMQSVAGSARAVDTETQSVGSVCPPRA